MNGKYTPFNKHKKELNQKERNEVYEPYIIYV